MMEPSDDNGDIENPVSSLNSIELSSSPSSVLNGSSAGVGESESSAPTTTSSSSSNSNYNSSNNQLWTLRVLSFQNVEIQIPSTSTIRQLKATVRDALLDSSTTNPNPNMRLICKGKLLAPDTAPLQEFKVQNGDVVHAVLAKQRPVGEENSATTNNNANTTGHRRRRRNTRNRPRRNQQIVGPGGRVTRATQHGEDDDDSSTSSYSTGDEESSPRLGLDRLLRRRGGAAAAASSGSNSNSNNNATPTGGLSRQDVAVMRTYFARQIDRYGQTHNAHMDEPDLTRRRLLVEEDWMAAQGPTSEFRLNLNQSLLTNNLVRSLRGNDPFGTGTGQGPFSRGHAGTDRDFAWGFMLGFFVGFVMLVWVWMPTVPHKQKLGILTGISFQLALNVLNDDEEEPDEFESPVHGGYNPHPHGN